MSGRPIHPWQMPVEQPTPVGPSVPPVRGEYDFHPLYERTKLHVDPIFEDVNPSTNEIVQRSIAEVKPLAKARVREWRWNKSIGGLTLPNGMFLATDEVTRSTIHQAIDLIDMGIKTEPFNYSVPGGYVSLTRVDLVAMAAASATFVQSCFDAGKVAEDGIDAATDVQRVRDILAAIV